jgi:uncharacterized protein YbcC (UPF0753/DUF2309 family)
MSRRAFFDRRVFLISYDPLPDVDGRILEATLLAAGPVGAGINLEYYFSTVDNEALRLRFSKVMHNLAGLFAVMQGTSFGPAYRPTVADDRNPRTDAAAGRSSSKALEICSPPIYQRQAPLQELIGNGWVVLAAKHPQTASDSPVRSGQRLATHGRLNGGDEAAPTNRRSRALARLLRRPP